MDALLAVVQKFPCARACVRQRRDRVALCIFGGIPEKCDLPRWTAVATSLYEQRLSATYVLPWPIIPARFTGRAYIADIARCLALAQHEVAVDVSALGPCDENTLRRVLLEVVHAVLCTLGQTVEWVVVSACQTRAVVDCVLPSLGLKRLPFPSSPEILSIDWNSLAAPQLVRDAVHSGLELTSVNTLFDTIPD
tara:strand:+ start:200 stop:781 length:582 start_codon:yes stop_codon:yes gene_type:complete